MSTARHAIQHAVAIALGSLLTAVSAGSYAASEDTAITIYSSAQPGAISPDLYRPVPGGGVPNACQRARLRDGSTRARRSSSRTAAPH